VALGGSTGRPVSRAMLTRGQSSELDAVLKVEECDGAVLELRPDDPLCGEAEAVAIEAD